MLRTLKNHMPDAFIDFLCIPSTADALKNNLLLRHAIVYDKTGRHKLSGLYNIISRIRIENYDFVICPHRSFRSALVTYFSRAKFRIGFDRNSLSFLLTRQVPYNRKVHEVERNLDLVKNIPAIKYREDKVEQKPKLFPSPHDVLFVEKLLTEFISSGQSSVPDNLITFAPCSKWFTKQLPVNKSVEITKALIDSGFRIILIGGFEDINYCKGLEKIVSDVNLVNLCGRLTPLQSSVVIGESKCLVTVDSAAAHLGASTDTPIVMIYGSTLPAFGFYPLTSKNVIIENKSLTCRPCTDHGRKNCPLKHLKCMEDLKVEEIIQGIDKLTT
jgi:heptosyltransferase-2